MFVGILIPFMTADFFFSYKVFRDFVFNVFCIVSLFNYVHLQKV